MELDQRPPISPPPRRQIGSPGDGQALPPPPPFRLSRPMTLGNMRELGVRSLAVTCEMCHHEVVLPADLWSDAVLVRAFAPRMVCIVCGIVGADARPNWREMGASDNWRNGAAGRISGDSASCSS